MGARRALATQTRRFPARAVIPRHRVYVSLSAMLASMLAIGVGVYHMGGPRSRCRFATPLTLSTPDSRT